MTKHWLSCTKFTVEVETDTRGIITKAAPIVRKFQGQPLAKLIGWMRDIGGFHYEILGAEKP